MSSNYRYSGSSSAFGSRNRDSSSSTNTTWTHYSHRSKGSLSSQLESPLKCISERRSDETLKTVVQDGPPRSLESNVQKAIPESRPDDFRFPPANRSSAAGSAQLITHSFIHEDRSTPEDSYLDSDFSTCVSRRKRCRQNSADLKYWCTSCKEGFGKKFDWKRHEETFQERTERYLCELCNKTFFLAKDFQKHHQDSHRCMRCEEVRHCEKARQTLKPRTAWGCGFCQELLTDWSLRCNHIAQHFEDGYNLAKWHHTNVILALLRQPGVAHAWSNLLAKKGKTRPYFHFHPKTTGRAEGYPYTRRSPQLQDLLEFFTPGQDVDGLIERVWEEGYRAPEPSPSHLNKDLPPLPRVNEIQNTSFHTADHQTREPIVPQPTNGNGSDGDLMDTSYGASHEQEQKMFGGLEDAPMAYFGEPLRDNWHPISSTIVPDELLADASFMDPSFLDRNFGNLWEDNFTFYAQGSQ